VNASRLALYAPIFLEFLKQFNGSAVVDFFDREKGEMPFEQKR
jgi:hypothetical protein